MVVGADLSTSSLNALLKDKYTQGVTDLNVNDLFVYNRLTTAPERFNGRQLIGAVSIGRSTAYQGQPQVGAVYPTPGSSDAYNWAIPACVATGTQAVEEAAMYMTQGDDGAFAEALTQDYMSWMENFKDEKERKVMGNGSAILNIHGGIGRIPGGGALDTTVAGWQFAVSIYEYRKMRKNVRFGIARVTTALNYATWRDAVILTLPAQGFFTIRSADIDTTNGVVIVTVNEPVSGGTLPTAAGEFGTSTNLDFMYAAGQILENAHPTDGTNLGLECMGLDGIVNGSNALGATTAYAETGAQWLQYGQAGTPYATGTFQNLSPTTVPEWKCNMVNARSLNTKLTQTILNFASVFQNMFGTAGTSKWAMWLLNPMQIEAYARSIQAKERYNINANTPSALPTGRNSLNQRAGQGEAMEHAGIAMYGSTMCRADTGYAITSDGAEKAVLKPFSFRDDGLSNDGRAMEVQKGMEIENLLTRDRKKCLRIDGLALPSFTLT